MTSSLKKLEQNNYELTVEVSREELSDYIKKIESRISQDVKLDGFRKGKAPKDMIRKEVGEKYILEEALDLALRDSLAKTIEKDNIEALKVYDLQIKENSASKLLYTTKIQIFPQIDIGNLNSLKIKRKQVDVDRKDIEEALDFLASSRSKFNAKNKMAEKGDRLEIDFEVTSDGLPIEGGISKNHPVILGDNKFMPGFEDQLMGLKQGDEKKFSLTAPKDYFNKTIAGKKLDFSVKVITVQEVTKPPINDEFARSLGQFKDLRGLEHNISEGIMEEKRVKERQRLRLEILAGILEKTKIELPKDMIEEKLNEMISGFDNELHSKGMELSLHLAHLNKTQEDLKKDWREEASRQISFALILKKIAKDKGIKPSDEEIQKNTEKMIQTMALRGEIDKENINLEAIREAVSNDLINEKVFKFLEDNYSA